MSNADIRRRLVITGQVQGVGFRPFIFRLAEELQLSGTVRNAPEGVVIEVQGQPKLVDQFARRVEREQPPLARILRVTVQDLPPEAGAAGFSIRKSSAGVGNNVLISPDTATCPDCEAELFDKANRRFLYPFINCTNCGPRFTITRSVPYDRPNTSMGCFPLCPDCQREYDNPRDRRFHAPAQRLPRVRPQGVAGGPLRHGGGPARRGHAQAGGHPHAGRHRRGEGPGAASIWCATPPARRPCASCAAANAVRTSRWPSWCPTSKPRAPWPR